MGPLSISLCYLIYGKTCHDSETEYIYGRIACSGLGIGYSGRSHKKLPTVFLWRNVNRPSCDGLLQVSTSGPMEMEAVWLRGKCWITPSETDGCCFWLFGSQRNEFHSPLLVTQVSSGGRLCLLKWLRSTLWQLGVLPPGPVFMKDMKLLVDQVHSPNQAQGSCF